MEKKEDYEKLYDMLLGYEQEIHKKNQKRIRIGLRCLIITTTSAFPISPKESVSA